MPLTAEAQAASAEDAPPSNCLIRAFDPNPIATANDPTILSRAFVLDRQQVYRSPVALQSLGNGQLQNKWFRLTDDNGTPYLNGAGCHDLAFRWQDNRFAFVATLASLERVRAWLDQNGLAHAVPQNLHVRVSETEQTSRYDPTSRTLIIGARQCDQVACVCGLSSFPCPKSADGRSIWPHAQDGDVVAHEYSHAVLHHLICAARDGCLLPTGAFTGSLDEAFADYLASAVNRSNSKQKNDPYCFAEWYNSLQLETEPCLRRLDSALHWPEAARGLQGAQLYSYATIWASALFKARIAAGDQAGLVDRIVFDAYSGFQDNTTFEQMAHRLIDAASRLDPNDQTGSSLRESLSDQGFLQLVESVDIATGSSRATILRSEMSSWEQSAYPHFDNTQTFLIAKDAKAVGLRFDRIRLKDGNCDTGSCGRIHVLDGNGRLYQVISNVYDSFETVAVPGTTITLRYIASYDHPRTVIYRIVGATIYQ